MTLLSIANLKLSVGRRILLDGVNLTLADGEHIGLVGRNGCGKSCLLRAIAGTDTLLPSGGQVQVQRGINVGMLTQDPQLDPDKSLRQEAAGAFSHLEQLHQRLESLSHKMADAHGDQLTRLLKQYEKVGVRELDVDKLPNLIALKYDTPHDARDRLGEMSHIREVFVGFQKHLYDTAVA